MLTTAEALEAVLAATPMAGTIKVPAGESTGQILRQTVVAERDQPPFDRVMMDGIAIAWSDVDRGMRRFPVQAMQAAGDQQLTLEPGHCIEIMTGAVVPQGADCIVPVERLALTDGIAEIEHDYEIVKDRFIHPRGSDCARGAHWLVPGKRISPLDIAIIASAGLTDVEVSTDPVIRMISTGDELVAPGEPIEAHQIRLSNGPAIVAMMESYGYRNAEHSHIIDDIDAMRERFRQHLDQASVLILSGGVSMGKADFVPAVLAELGVEKIFHRISQRPGKPMWFGKGPNEQLVFALPGNPVSALVCCRQYVIPSLQKAAGMAVGPPEFAALAARIVFEPKLTCYQPVKLISSAGGQLLAMPVKTNTSGDFASLSATDGYVELPLEPSVFEAGTPAILYRWIVR